MLNSLKKLLTVALCFAFAFNANAQSLRKAEGIVKDVAGEPIPGAAVMDNNGHATVTDLNGGFAMQVAQGSVTLEVSCLGYQTRTVTLPSAQSYISVTLLEDSTLLSETVVVGYGVQKKVNLTGAVSSVTSKELENRTSGTITHMLQGAVPGLFVTTASGNPSDEPSINIRGVNSLNGGDPLVLIDGVEGSLAKVNPQDVESISVIKDASSSAIYGARASFGVVLVTTKSGANSDGKATVRYSGHFGFSTPTTRTDYISTGYDSVYITDLFHRGSHNVNLTNYTEADMEQLYLRRNDKVEDPSRPWVVIENRNGEDSYIYYANTDWYHELYTDINPMTQHNFSVSGGTEHMKYFFSAGYEHKEGTFKIRHDNYNKYNLRSKMDIKLTDWLSLNNNTAYYSKDYDWPGNGNVNYTFAYGAVHGLASFPLKNPDGTNVYKTILLNSNVTNGCHIELLDDTKVNREKKNNFSNTTELTAHVIEGLDVKMNFTYTLDSESLLNRWTNASYSKYPGVIEWDRQGRFENKLDEKTITTQYKAVNLYANYHHDFEGGHHFNAIAGMNYEHNIYKQQRTSGKNLSSQYLSDFNLVQPDDKGVKAWDVTGGQGEYAIAGVFARINYDYMEKYLFEMSGRFDGTSRFDAAHRWGFFPSASAGWKFSEEDFMEEADWLNVGKLRFSYGVLGNQQVGLYDFIRKMNLGKANWLFDSDTQFGSSATLTAPNAGDLSWETTRHYNLGLDLSTLGNRLNFSGEAYIRSTEGMLTSADILPSVYGAPTPLRNGANMQARGYELTLSWKDSFTLGGYPFNYGVNATFNDYISVITKYRNPSRLMGTFYEGQRLGEIWGFTTDGLFQSDEEAAEYTKKVDQSYVAGKLNGGWLAGDIKYVDLDGNGEINKGSFTIDEPGDLKIIGNSNPRYQYGMTLTASYRGFDFSMFMQGVGRMDWYPPVYSHAFWGPFNQASQSFVRKDFMSMVWSEDNPNAYFPRPRAGIGNEGGTQITTVNDRYLINIGYCRLKNLTIGYTMPDKLMRVLPFSNVRVYFTGENLGYASPLKKVTKYMDPEQCATSSYLGFLYPWQKSFIFGIDVTF